MDWNNKQKTLEIWACRGIDRKSTPPKKNRVPAQRFVERADWEAGKQGERGFPPDAFWSKGNHQSVLVSAEVLRPSPIAGRLYPKLRRAEIQENVSDSAEASARPEGDVLQILRGLSQPIFNLQRRSSLPVQGFHSGGPGREDKGRG